VRHVLSIWLRVALYLAILASFTFPFAR